MDKNTFFRFYCQNEQLGLFITKKVKKKYKNKNLSVFLPEASETVWSVLKLLSAFVSFRYITQQGHKLEIGAIRPPATVTNAVSWRSEGIKYRKNEVFMDVIESVNLLVRTVFVFFLTPCSSCNITR